MNSKHLLIALVAAPALLALEPRADEVHFAPSEGSSLKKTFGIEFNLGLGDLTVIADGVDASEGIPGDLEVTTEISMTVVDTYVDVESEKPLDLIRLYDALSLAWETPGESGSSDEDFSGLAGKQVRFLWNGDTETYAVTYHEDEGDQEKLEGLGVDMDLRSMLPTAEVSEGDTWTLAADQIVPLLTFGFEPRMPDLEDDPEGVGALIESELLPQIESLLEGLAAECTYAGRREVDGVTMGAIDLKLQGEGTLDLSSLLVQMIEAQAEGVTLSVDVDEAIVDLVLDGEGTLVWDLQGGHLHSFEMSPELEILVDVSLSVDVAGDVHDFEASVELLGSGNWTAAVVK